MIIKLFVHILRYNDIYNELVEVVLVRESATFSRGHVQTEVMLFAGEDSMLYKLHVLQSSSKKKRKTKIKKRITKRKMRWQWKPTNLRT